MINPQSCCGNEGFAASATRSMHSSPVWKSSSCLHTRKCSLIGMIFWIHCFIWQVPSSSSSPSSSSIRSIHSWQARFAREAWALDKSFAGLRSQYHRKVGPHWRHIMEKVLWAEICKRLSSVLSISHLLATCQMSAKTLFDQTTIMEMSWQKYLTSSTLQLAVSNVALCQSGETPTPSEAAKQVPFCNDIIRPWLDFTAP